MALGHDDQVLADPDIGIVAPVSEAYFTGGSRLLPALDGPEPAAALRSQRGRRREPCTVREWTATTPIFAWAPPFAAGSLRGSRWMLPRRDGGFVGARPPCSTSTWCGREGVWPGRPMILVAAGGRLPAQRGRFPRARGAGGTGSQREPASERRLLGRRAESRIADASWARSSLTAPTISNEPRSEYSGPLALLRAGTALPWGSRTSPCRRSTPTGPTSRARALVFNGEDTLDTLGMRATTPGSSGSPSSAA